MNRNMALRGIKVMAYFQVVLQELCMFFKHLDYTTGLFFLSELHYFLICTYAAGPGVQA